MTGVRTVEGDQVRGLGDYAVGSKFNQGLGAGRDGQNGSRHKYEDRRAFPN